MPTPCPEPLPSTTSVSPSNATRSMAVDHTRLYPSKRRRSAPVIVTDRVLPATATFFARPVFVFDATEIDATGSRNKARNAASTSLRAMRALHEYRSAALQNPHAEPGKYG